MSIWFSRAVRFSCPCVLAFLLNGCTTESQDGSATVFAYAPWVPLAIMGGGVAATIVGVATLRNIAREKLLRESLPELARDVGSTTIPAVRDFARRSNTFRSTLFGWWLVVCGSAAIVVFAPSNYMESVKVSDETIEVDSGLWMLPTFHYIEFKAVSRFELIAEERPRRRENTVDYYLICRCKNGDRPQLRISDLLNERAIEKIMEVARTRHIPVIDSR